MKYEGEKYSLMKVPPVTSPLVVAERNRLFGVIDLEALDLSRPCELVRVAHNHPGIARNKILEISVKRIGDEVAGLRDKAATTVEKLSRTLHSMLLDLQSVYKHLLDGKEEIAVDTLRAALKLVATAGKAAEELSMMFETEEEKIEGIIKQTITKKAEEEKHEARTWTQSIEGLHNAIGALKYLTVSLLQSADFWKKMQVHCKLIVDMKVDQRVEIVLPKPQKTRERLWAKSEFKQVLIIFFARCVSLEGVCTTYSNLLTGEISTPQCDALEDMCTMYSEMVKDKVSTLHTSKVDTLGKCAIAVKYSILSSKQQLTTVVGVAGLHCKTRVYVKAVVMAGPGSAHAWPKHHVCPAHVMRSYTKREIEWLVTGQYQ